MQSYLKAKSFLFFLSLLALFVLYPLFERNIIERTLLNIAATFILIAAIHAVSSKRKHFIGALILVVPALLLFWLAYFLFKPSFLLFSLSLMVVFFLYVIFLMLGDILTKDEVQSDTIYRAACIYMLLGLLWAMLYAILEYLVPGSLMANNPQVAGGRIYLDYGDFSHLLYYSFVTLTTLGDGEILPVNSPARALSILEAIIGQLYLVILVAGLVSVHVSQFRQRNKDQKS